MACLFSPSLLPTQKGGKFSNWEGGIRVSAVISGGFLPPARRGKIESGLISHWDMYATYCALMDVDPADDKAAKAGLPPIDSFNMWPLISGANATSPRSAHIIGAPSNTTSQGEGPAAARMNVTVQGIIVLPYKLLIGPLLWSAWTGQVHPNASGAGDLAALQHCGDPAGTMFPQGPGCLYDIVSDPGEHVNLATQPAHAATKAALRALIAEAQAGVFNPRRGTSNSTLLCAAAGAARGFLTPFLP